MSIHTEKSWKRHSNPWSVWTRILTNPLVYLPLWNRSWKQGAVVAAWFAANPLIFPAPEDDSSWATRSVLGEQLWTAERRRDIPMALNAASAVFFAGALVAAYRRRLWPMMLCAGPSLLLKLWFLDRMTFYYEEHREQEAAGGAAQQAQDAAGQATQQAQQAAGGGRQAEPDATEAARQKAEQLGVGLSQVQGSGAGGRITVKDVQSAANQQ